ncbi:MAG: sulfatase-like hydrolase/transferase [Acidobacteria bacterium]|nr:sulfatase-like hydrolase/transferase [Acidobacteriota bacterium]
MITRRHLLSTAAATPWLKAADRKPNIIFLFSDDHHFQCLGAAGNPHIHTPNLDRLASSGILFINGIISTSQCCPSRGIMLSGRETYQTGLLSNGATDFKPGVGPTVVEQLRRGGYDTIHIGKWHIRPEPGPSGFNRSPLWLRGGGSIYRDPMLRRGQQGADEKVEGHITDLFTDAAIGVVKDARQPFFLWQAYNAPHVPLYAAQKYYDRYRGKTNEQLAPPLHPKGGSPFDWATYYAVITHLDEAIGRLTDALRKSGQWDNTVIFFIGDNGYMAGTRNWNGKVRHWDESVRVPYFVSGGAVKKAFRVDDPVASVDTAATWLDLAGIKPEKPLAGRSLRSYLETGKGDLDAAFSTWDDGRAEGLAARVAIEPYRLVRTRRHKLVVWQSKKQALYDCVADPAEERDLIEDAKLAAVREDLRKKLRARMEVTGDHAVAWFS